MAHSTRKLKGLATGFAPVMALFVLILASLYMLSGAAHNSAEFSRWYTPLLAINILGIVLLTVLIGINIYRLVRQYRNQEMGSRLTMRLVAIFVILAVAPVSVVYYFSLGFLQRGIDSWFDVQTETALNDAIDLSRTALDERMRELHKQTERMAVQLHGTPPSMVAFALNDLRQRSGATEITLLTNANRIIATSSNDPGTVVPNRPDEAILMQLRQGRSYVGLDPIPESGLHIRAVVKVAPPDTVGEPQILQALFPVAERIGRLAENVQNAFARYKELSFLREPLKYSFVLTLSLVLLQSLLVAVWVAFYSARRLVAPIQTLAFGTRAVAAGNYEKQLPLYSSDELGMLVQSFNDMTRRIAMARDEAKTSQREAEEQKAYLESVLGRLSSGVLTLDMRHCLRTANLAADHILGARLSHMIGARLDTIAGEHPYLGRFMDVIRPHLRNRGQEWREEITLAHGGRHQILMCRGTTLPPLEGVQAGYVVVFDDITALVQAQRDAAWGEMARRLAHEIKNPLTPIQLAAERLRHKYLALMPGKDADVLERSTRTIVQQVAHMKEMVKAFSDYAYAPKLQMQPLRLNELVEEVVDLYRGEGADINVQMRLSEALPIIEMDAGRIRQLLHNLLKNAREAMEGRPATNIVITTRYVREPPQGFVELRVEDDGPGIPEEILERVFEPYVTTKPKGTGLGLAIVKKIVEEHRGSIAIENQPRGGACITARFPAIASANSLAGSRAAAGRGGPIKAVYGIESVNRPPDIKRNQ